jgi:hypothetical protein
VGESNSQNKASGIPCGEEDFSNVNNQLQVKKGLPDPQALEEAWETLGLQRCKLPQTSRSIGPVVLRGTWSSGEKEGELGSPLLFSPPCLRGREESKGGFVS